MLHKLARNLGLPKLTFQVIRRTIATLAGTAKDVQGVMRHSRTATTTDVYMQKVSESVQTTIKLHQPGAEEVVGKESPKYGEAIAGCGDFGEGGTQARRYVSEGVWKSDTK